jgi:hypothetical protein
MKAFLKKLYQMADTWPALCGMALLVGFFSPWWLCLLLCLPLGAAAYFTGEREGGK